MRHDLLNDALAMIKNAEGSGKPAVTLRPASKLVARVLRVLRENGYVGDFTFQEDGRGGAYEVLLSGNVNDCGVIKPRFAVKRTDLQKYESRFLPAQDFGVLILTTTEGVLTHSQAKEAGIGGRLLAYCY
ncbi:MAG: 30S ribosomal protein S8 [Thermoplasmata archaeon]